MSCLRTFCEDFLRLVSLGYLAAGLVLIWTVSVLVDLRKPVTLLRLREFWYPDPSLAIGNLRWQLLCRRSWRSALL